jgi:predicted aspartyl protease
MSNHPFNAKSGPILVNTEITGPLGSAALKLVLDTGATISLINLAAVLSLGYDPRQSTKRITVMTGSALAVVPVIVLTRLSALGEHRFGFPVTSHSLPAGIGVDGLLGLDFCRNLTLTIDFRTGQINLK